MTNGELFIRENPTVETKINGSCVWIYFDGVNHYTMPVEWWDKEIGLFNDIKTEIEGNMESIIGKYDPSIPKFNMPSYKIERNKAREECISIIDKYKAERSEE